VAAPRGGGAVTDVRTIAMRFTGPIAGRARHLAYPLAEAAGLAAWQLRPAMRSAVIRNMRFAGVPPAEARAASRRVVRRAACYWVDAASMPYRDMTTFEARHLRLSGAEHLATFKEQGPIIIASAHTGNAELAIQALLARQRPFVALVEPLEPPEFMEAMLRNRTFAGARFVAADREGVRTCIQALRGGGVVGLMADRDFAGTGICVELFGREVRLPRGPWELARRHGARVIPIFCLRRRHDRFTVRAFEPFAVERTADAEGDIRRAASRWVEAFEATLRPDPAQWVLLGDYLREQACAPS